MISLVMQVYKTLFSIAYNAGFIQLIPTAGISFPVFFPFTEDLQDLTGQPGMNVLFEEPDVPDWRFR